MGCKEHLKLSVKNKKENISLFEIIIVGEITLHKKLIKELIKDVYGTILYYRNIWNIYIFILPSFNIY